MKKIELSQGKFTTVDDGDYEWLNQWKWHYQSNRRKYCKEEDSEIETGYAVRNQRIKGGRQITIFMHKLILDTPKGMDSDHKNGDGLDNRRSNLRICTRSQNNMNQIKTKGSSRFKGVSWNKQKERWSSQIQKNGKSSYLGIFDDEEEAALTYNNAAQEMFGEFARLNVL